MTQGTAAQTGAPVKAAVRRLKEVGAFLIAAADLNRCLGVDDGLRTRQAPLVADLSQGPCPLDRNVSRHSAGGSCEGPLGNSRGPSGSVNSG